MISVEAAGNDKNSVKHNLVLDTYLSEQGDPQGKSDC